MAPTAKIRAIAALVLLGVSSIALSQESSRDLTPALRCVPIGFCFCVRPAFGDAIDAKTTLFRSRLAEARKAGRTIGYLSIPLSGGAGANFDVNREAAGSIESAIQERFGKGYVYLLNPATPDADLPKVGSEAASQGEYLYLWAQILSGDDGFGRDLDFVYFAGPSDFAVHFKMKENDRIGTLVSYFDNRYKENAQFKADVDKGKLVRGDFLVYYGLKASVSFSRGCHDEWNLVESINERRNRFPADFGTQRSLPVWFDGRQVDPSDYQVRISPGNATTTCGR